MSAVASEGYLRPVKLATLMDFKPFVWCEKGYAKGIDVDILAELFRRIDRTYDIECLPWKRAINYVRIGRLDGLFSGYKTQQREQFATYLSAPFHTSVFSVFVRKSKSFNFDSISDLNGRVIGITRGYSINPEFDAARKTGKFYVSESSSTDKGIDMLLAARTEAYLNSRHVVWYTARELGISHKIDELPAPLHTPKPAYMMLSKASNLPGKDKLVESLNRTLEEMWEDGTVDAIINGYIDPAGTHLSTP
ncbi:substrate-binding periplasmic protein [Aestuariirhabdus haliotis]|nr:transporter substrate-binding domain-containing protein [Aestuariirhabdus haliotis]MCL6421696.1 transporter substrate-binding domain-containing protein [Aestuariirhabdus haliotis]